MRTQLHWMFYTPTLILQKTKTKDKHPTTTITRRGRPEQLRSQKVALEHKVTPEIREKNNEIR